MRRQQAQGCGFSLHMARSWGARPRHGGGSSPSPASSAARKGRAQARAGSGLVGTRSCKRHSILVIDHRALSQLWPRTEPSGTWFCPGHWPDSPRRPQATRATTRQVSLPEAAPAHVPTSPDPARIHHRAASSARPQPGLPPPQGPWDGARGPGSPSEPAPLLSTPHAHRRPVHRAPWGSAAGQGEELAWSGRRDT